MQRRLLPAAAELPLRMESSRVPDPRPSLTNLAGKLAALCFSKVSAAEHDFNQQSKSQGTRFIVLAVGNVCPGQHWSQYVQSSLIPPSISQNRGIEFLGFWPWVSPELKPVPLGSVLVILATLGF